MPLKYGARVTGVIVISKLGLDQFDADDLRLLEVMAGHASVALENARLYEAQRREAESAKALLEFSRELAEASTIADVAERATARRSGHPRECEHLGVATERGNGIARPARGHPRSCRRGRPEHSRGAPRAVARSHRAVHGRSRRLRGDRFRARGHRRAVRDRSVHGRRALGSHRRRDHPRDLPPRIGSWSSWRASRARHGSRCRRPTSYETLERTFLSTVEALANALEANDEYTSTHARWITDLALRVGEELGSRRTGAEAPRARRALPRHRQDRDPVTHPREGRPAHRRGARPRRDAPRPRGAHPRADREARRGSARSSAAPTSTTTARAIPTTSSASRSRSSRASSSPATPTTR